MSKQYIPANNLSIRCLLILGGILLIYLLDNLLISAYIGYESYNYIVKPGLWLGTAYLVWLSPRGRFKSTLKRKENILLWGFIFATIYIIMTIVAGLIEGFGKSPYSHSLSGILLNMLVIGSMLIGREYSRGFIINHLAKKEKYTVFLFVSFIFTLMSYPVSKFTALNSTEEAVELAARYIIPEFCHHLLASYLTFLGGWLASFIYWSIMMAFEWLSPILPDLKWITTAFIGILCPVFCLFGIQNMHIQQIGKLKKSKEKKERTFAWILTSTFSIGVIWFSVGVFPVYPSVIATGSMEPVIYPGDMIFVEKITKEEEFTQLKEGDVIQFERDNMLISHRIVKIIENNSQIRYCTKGDNNTSPDATLVKPEDIKGKVVYIIPKVGWPTLLIKRNDDAPLDEIQF